jgi:DNA polymerase III subunit delta
MLGAVADLKPAYLLSGSDRPKVTRALRRLRSRVGEEAIETFSARETSGEEIVAACNALGLFAGEHRLVVVADVDAWKSPDVKAVTAYLADPAPTTVLALVTEEAKPGSPLAKAIAAAGELLVYELPKRGSRADLPGWVAKQFASAGAEVPSQACRLLVELVGDNPDELAAEIDKVLTWAGGEPIGEREVETLIAPRAETPPFALTDGWGRRDVAAVLGASQGLLERSGDPPRDVLPRIVGVLTAHVSRVATCQRLAAEGVTPREAAERMKKNHFYVQKLFEQSANFSTDELRDAVIRLAQLDEALKGGSRLPGELELERALLEITRGPEPARVG